MRGSFTVEAALNFSCVIAGLMFFIYMGFYLHDKTILEQAASMAAQNGRLYVVENQRMEDAYADWERFGQKGLLWRIFDSVSEGEIVEYAAELVRGRLLVCEDPAFSVNVGADKVTVTYKAKTLLKGVYLSGVGIVIPQISGTVTDTGIEGEEFVRLVRAIMEEG